MMTASRTFALQKKLDALALALEKLAEEKLAPREQNTAKRLGQAMQARREGYTAQRAAKLARGMAMAMLTLEDLPEVLEKLPINKARFLKAAAQQGEYVSNGYHGYHVDNGKFTDTSPEAEALRKLCDPSDSPEAKRRQELERMEAKLRQVNVDGFFPTPPEVIRKMVLVANLNHGMTVLEPSAGKGDILTYLRDTAKLEVKAKGYERIHVLAEYCRELEHDVECVDFLTVKPTMLYDRVLMNPPFEKGMDRLHVWHAWEFVKPGGCLVSVMGAGVFSRQTMADAEFQHWVEMDGEVEDLPDGSFAKAFNRTGVSTKLVWFWK